ncbi:hypothetical protein [Burkholderia thailandensis]|uniref:hypothetical protein n=1 Tax=Burkholderia thailandensis TaxID=57975 RepID=UPI00016A39BF|nr:hypothetical protein [Burkholderia thailandensis]AIP64843.1 hypothetical protein DR62_279 [Burkholderia thailandensis]AOI51216.1 hypothetical protein WI24_04955 [Burkholderia thailandensis]
MVNQTSRARNRPLYEAAALTAFTGFAVEQRDDGSAAFHGSYADPHGTKRTQRRFVEFVLDAHGEWCGRNGIKFFEHRAAWRPLTDAAGRLSAIAFARHAVDYVRQQANDQISVLHGVEQSISRSV